MSKEALRIALEALEYWDVHGKLHQPTEEAITAIKQALEQPVQEPVAWISQNAGLYHGKPDESVNPLPLYLAPFAGDIRALKHRIHELEGELIGYKKIVADQDAMLERQAARIVDLQTHIDNFDGEDR